VPFPLLSVWLDQGVGEGDASFFLSSSFLSPGFSFFFEVFFAGFLVDFFTPVLFFGCFFVAPGRAYVFGVALPFLPALAL